MQTEGATRPMTTYLSAEKLGIEPEDRELLLRTRELLAKPLPDGLGFDMSGWFNNHHTCGTACCIGGYMHLVGGGKLEAAQAQRLRDLPSGVIKSDHGFGELFYPNVGSRGWNELTPADAIEAIDNFLSGNTQDPWAFARPA